MIHDKQLLSCLARLHRDNDFRKFKELYLDELLTEYVQLCIELENPARPQGAAQVLQRIQTDLAEAEQGYIRISQSGEVPLS